MFTNPTDYIWGLFHQLHWDDGWISVYSANIWIEFETSYFSSMDMLNRCNKPHSISQRSRIILDVNHHITSRSPRCWDEILISSPLLPHSSHHRNNMLDALSPHWWQTEAMCCHHSALRASYSQATYNLKRKKNHNKDVVQSGVLGPGAHLHLLTTILINIYDLRI